MTYPARNGALILRAHIDGIGCRRTVIEINDNGRTKANKEVQRQHQRALPALSPSVLLSTFVLGPSP